MNFSIDELTIISMYTGGELTAESRERLIRELTDAWPFIEDGELRNLVDSVREKVRCMSEDEFEKIYLSISLMKKFEPTIDFISHCTCPLLPIYYQQYGIFFHRLLLLHYSKAQ